MALPTIYLGADHNGFALKERLKRWLMKRGLTVRDVGADRLRPADDYPVFAAAVARAVRAGRGDGLLICGSGHGMAIAANRFQGIRAAVCPTPASARHARHDDHGNILILAAWDLTPARALGIVRTWLQTPFSRAPRHRRRIAMIESAKS